MVSSGNHERDASDVSRIHPSPSLFTGKMSDFLSTLSSRILFFLFLSRLSLLRTIHEIAQIFNESQPSFHTAPLPS